jgi:outer membrane receptor protein involved in Fe transport
MRQHGFGHGGVRVRRRGRGRAVAALLLAAAGLVAFAATAAAQTTGSVLGQVVDPETGQPLRGAEVRVLQLPLATQTGEDGRFVLAAVPAGERTIRVQSAGYRPVTLGGVIVRAGQATELRFELEISPLALPGLTVQAERLRLIEPEVSASQQVVLGQELRELPITVVAEAIELMPGVSDGHFRGGRAGQEVYVVDGIELKNQLEASAHGFGLEFSPSSLEEVGVLTGGFGATRSAGAAAPPWPPTTGCPRRCCAASPASRPRPMARCRSWATARRCSPTSSPRACSTPIREPAA